MSDADLKPVDRWIRRPLFSPSQMLTAQQLNLLMEGQRRQSDMLMRALHGHGIIFGYAVSLFAGRRAQGPAVAAALKRGKLWVECGMALDRHGRLLNWPDDTLAFCDIVNRPKRDQDCAGWYTLRVHYARRRVPKGGCGPCADKPEWIEEGVAFTLVPAPRQGRPAGRPCPEADRACPHPADQDACISWEDYICLRTRGASGALPPASDLEWACFIPGEPCPDDCGEIEYDADAGIPIACVRVANVAAKNCPREWGFTEIGQACEVRPRVYRTPLLYELVRGCQDNLARVESLSWQDWIVDPARHIWDFDVPWGEFRDRLLDPDGLKIAFTKPILVRTVHPGSVFLTSVYWEKRADYMVTRRIPAYPRPTTEGDFATEFRLEIRPEWIGNELTSRSELREGGRIELTIRGQLLRDRCRNMLNAVPLFYEPKTPGQDQAGADFTAIFSYGPYSGPAEVPEPAAPIQEAPAPASQIKY